MTLVSFSSLPSYLRTARQGEQVAADYLRSIGWTIHGQNIRVGRRDEIDILAYDPEDDVLVFAEVKSAARHLPDFLPQHRIRGDKRKFLYRAARRYVARNRYEGGWRIDLICTIGGRVQEHFREISERC